jgi:dihydrofolate synthase / folylpolyglutamate synthase
MQETINYHKDLSYWEDRISNCHSKGMDFTPDRVREVARMAGLLNPKAKIITVAGTNGKGTSCAFLAEILKHYKKSVGVFSSPHLLKINERFNINGKLVGDDALSAAFNYVDNIRGDIKLTYFEFCTIAAFYLFKISNCEIWILEVGLGGRLDSTNILDADIALLTSIDLDHTNILGDSREKIAREKIGIFRENQIIICGDNNPPDIVKKHALHLGAEFYCAGVDYKIEDLINSVDQTNIPISNIAAVKMVLKAAFFDIYKQDNFENMFKDKMREVKVLGRMTQLDKDITSLKAPMICDGAHNSQAARYLVDSLKRHPVILAANKRGIGKSGFKLHFVFSAFADKDIPGILEPVLKFVSEYNSCWYLYEMDHPRFESTDKLTNYLKNGFREVKSLSISCDFKIFGISGENNIDSCELLNNILKQEVGSHDLVVVFGSFYLLSRVFEYFNIY